MARSLWRRDDNLLPKKEKNPEPAKSEAVAQQTLCLANFASIADDSLNETDSLKETEVNFFTGMFDFSDNKQSSGLLGLQHQNKELFRGAQLTSGAIFNTKIDRSHPINFGFQNENLAVFRNTNLYIKPDKQSYNNPIKYTNNPLLSGYISEENLELIKNTVPFQVQRMGRGRVIVLTDNTNFRAFWYGTNRILTNALYLSDKM